MILKRIKVHTSLAELTNCYIVQDVDTKETMVIDPGGDATTVMEMLTILEAKLKYIYLTHCHADHIGAAETIRSQLGGTVLIHRYDAQRTN